MRRSPTEIPWRLPASSRCNYQACVNPSAAASRCQGLISHNRENNTPARRVYVISAPRRAPVRLRVPGPDWATLRDFVLDADHVAGAAKQRERTVGELDAREVDHADAAAQKLGHCEFRHHGSL